jgi:hypothetical protein
MELTCIKCGAEAEIHFNLADGDTCHCPECDADFTIDEVESLIEQWGKILPWLKQHPARKPDPADASDLFLAQKAG